MISLFVAEYPFIVGLVSFLIGLIGMPLVIKIAKEKHLVVRPNKRMSHKGDIPNIGGLDICFSFLLTYILFESNVLTDGQFFLIGILVIVIVGFVDDVLVLSPFAKLCGEILSGLTLIGFADMRITHLHGLFGLQEISIIPSYILSLFILVAIINAINLIDGVDGLASGLGMLYCLFFTIYFHLAGQQAWSILALCLIGSLAVFFCYNVFGHRKKIFMGDSGSLLLGYIITAFVFHFCEVNAYHQIPQTLHMSAAPAVAISVLTIPIFDTIRVSLTRIKHHHSPFRPDKNHIHHLLLRAGLNHLQTTAVLLLTSLLFIGIAIVGRNWNMWLLIGVDFGLATLLTILLWRIVNKHEQKYA